MPCNSTAHVFFAKLKNSTVSFVIINVQTCNIQSCCCLLKKIYPSAAFSTIYSVDLDSGKITYFARRQFPTIDERTVIAGPILFHLTGGNELHVVTHARVVMM